MKSAQEITTRIAEAKQELIGITNPWVATPGQKSPGCIPPVETNELKKAANTDLTASPDPPVEEPQSPPEATDLEEKEEKAE